MTAQYPTVPLQWVDSIRELNAALAAYQEVTLGWLQTQLADTSHPDPQGVVCGLQMMFKPIQSGYAEMATQISASKLLKPLQEV